MKIGNIVLDNNIIVAPMAGITNTSYRKICKEMGAGLIVAEMVSDKAICYENKKTFDLLKVCDYERPISQQIFGSDVDTFVEATKKILSIMKPDIIDINMGCPVPKVAVRAQAGSSLLKNPDKVFEIVSAVVEVSTVPVTVKIRSGWDKSSINAVEIAKVCQKAGASAIAVHARTRAQGYEGKADWNIIKDVVEAVTIPVIGNGDVTSCYDAKRMLEETGCAGVMIGRGLLGNPWLVRDCVKFLESGEEPSIIDNLTKFKMMKKHLDYIYEDKSEREATLEMRSNLMYYLKGMQNTKSFKNSIVKCSNKDDYIKLIEEYETLERNT
ncbi:MAG: tRNA dihydrouridine synthase DusB [bacterium]